MEAGLTLRDFGPIDIEEIKDRGSKYFFCKDLDERTKRLRESPQPILLSPLAESEDFFLQVFQNHENPKARVQQH